MKFLMEFFINKKLNVMTYEKEKGKKGKERGGESFFEPQK